MNFLLFQNYLVLFQSQYYHHSFYFKISSDFNVKINQQVSLPISKSIKLYFNKIHPISAYFNFYYNIIQFQPTSISTTISSNFSLLLPTTISSNFSLLLPTTISSKHVIKTLHLQSTSILSLISVLSIPSQY
jgi:hypothetical protein